SFAIAAFCVTNEDYYQFARRNVRHMPAHWDAKWMDRTGRPFPRRLACQPVVNVTAADAQAYCASVGCRLPSWIQWERSASGPGPDPRVYPWGPTYSAAFCNSWESGRGSLAHVNDFAPGKSAEEILKLG